MTWLSGDEQNAINLFWNMAGGLEPYPRTLERSISLALPIAIIKLPKLALGSVENWLKTRQINFSFDSESRFLRGCLVAYGGKGIIFCDGTDPADEIRFTLAHEVGHFLIDYWYPRQKAIAKFGEGILEVFDGIREPSVAERVNSILVETKIGVVTNLMDRQDASDMTWTAESKADKIGLGLLAPPSDVLKGVHFPENKFAQRLAIITGKLSTQFGLPVTVSKIYANILLRSIGKGPSWAESLRGG